MTTCWTGAERRLLDSILDQLIPANPDRNIPAAGELGVADFISVELASTPGLRKAVAALLDGASRAGTAMSPALVSQLEADYPAEFLSLLTITYKGYYSRPDMRELVGVGSHPVHPDGYQVAAESPGLIDKLTAPVRHRGACYRDPARPDGRGG